MSIKNVAIVGGSGNLGPSVLNAVLDGGFNVTILSREESTATFPAACTVKKVKYDNLESIKAAFEGQDAVASTVGQIAVGTQKLLIDAALAAGVKRFIPSEFGLNTRTVTGPLASILKSKVAIVDYLMEKAKENPGFTWTGMSTGMFFDWGLDVGVSGPSSEDKTYVIRDSGNEPFSASDLSYIGKCVSGILKHPDETANKYLCVAGFTTTQNEILAFVEKETGEKWKVQKVDMKELQKVGEERLAKGDYGAFVDFLQVYMWGDGAGHALPDSENAASMLGIPPQSWQDSVRAWLKRKGLVA